MEIGKVARKRRLDELREHPLNQKYNTDITGVERAALTESIRQFGVLQPIVITPDGVILSGHQRWKIAQELKFKQIDCLEFYGTEQESIYFLVSENRARRESEKDPIKRALQYKVLWDQWGIQQGGDRSRNAHDERLTASDLAEMIGASASNVRKYLRLLDLIEPLQQLVSAGSIGLTVGNRFARLSPDQQEQAHLFIQQKQLDEIKISDFEEIVSLFEIDGEQPEKEPISERSARSSKFGKMEAQLSRWQEGLSDEERGLFRELLMRYAGDIADE